jgi:hypothetical protein
MSEADYRHQLPALVSPGGVPAIRQDDRASREAPAQVMALPAPPAVNENIDRDPPIETVITVHNVRERIVDYLGSVLARCWIDPTLIVKLDENPHQALRHIGILLPPEIDLKVERPHRDRPRLVIYECNAERTFRRRICYLQLIMMAGK